MMLVALLLAASTADQVASPSSVAPMSVTKDDYPRVTRRDGQTDVPVRPGVPTRLPGFAITEDDYPAFARRYEHTGVVGFTVRVDANGAPHDCVVAVSSTFAELDAKTCEIVEARMRFAPAREGHGEATVGTYSSHIRWHLEGSEPTPFGDGIRIEKFSFARDGTIADCTVETGGTMAGPQSPRCGTQWVGSLPNLLGAPLTEFGTATIVNALHAGDTVNPVALSDYGSQQFIGTIHFMVTTAGRVEQCVPENPARIARLIDVCSLIFAGQTDAKPQFSPGPAQRGSLSLIIYARLRPTAVLPPAAPPRP